MTRYRMKGSAVTEWVVVLAVFAVVMYITWVIFAPHQYGREESRQTVCMSKVRQIAVAALMYDQDNTGHFPGVDWVTQMSPYLGNNPVMFHCPASTDWDTTISYGYNGLLINPDGSGVTEKEINAPTEVGVVCDASPGRTYPNGGLICGGGLQPGMIAVTPDPRHSHGSVVGYADGHAEFAAHGYNSIDTSNAITRAFYLSSALGLVDNPSGGIGAFPIGNTIPDSVTIGGEPCTRAILLAAAGIWRKMASADIVLDGFNGQYAVKKHGSCYLWGTGDGVKPAGNEIAIARDAVVMIAAYPSRIPAKFMTGSAGDTYALDTASVRKLYGIGYRKKTLQIYTFPKSSGTRRFFSENFAENGKPLQFGPGSITVKDDFAMVNTVAKDPYGLGYCSSAIADPNKVQILGLKTPDGVLHLYPQSDPKNRWIVPDTPDWPLLRTLYAEYGGNAWTAEGTGIANVMLTPGAAGTQALQAGPLFKASYLLPK